MKPMLRQACCLFLVASLLLQIVPAAMAQACLSGNPDSGSLAAVRTELLEARRLLLEESGGKKSQDAVAPLDRAKKLAAGGDFAKAFSGKVHAFRADLDKARLKVLWNDRDEALAIVNRLLGLLDYAPPKGVPPCPNPAGNGPGAGAMLGATLLAGLGALVLLFFTGQVSHR